MWLGEKKMLNVQKFRKKTINQYHSGIHKMTLTDWMANYLNKERERESERENNNPSMHKASK